MNATKCANDNIVPRKNAARSKCGNKLSYETQRTLVHDDSISESTNIFDYAVEIPNGSNENNQTTYENNDAKNIKRLEARRRIEEIFEEKRLRAEIELDY